MTIPFVTNLVSVKIESWRTVVAFRTLAAIPTLLFGSTLSYFDA
jgi:6-phosphogluconate dehydrogenase